MYPAFTLYPHGGFMMCESVSEFDTNVQPPAPAIEPIKAVARLNEIDPVVKAISKLKDIYEQRVVPMLSDTYDLEHPENAVDRFDRLIGDVNAIVNTLRCMVVKMEALNNYYDGPNTPIYDSFRPHTGEFMLNANKIRQQGVEYSQYSYHCLPAFRSFYDTKAVVSIMLQNPQIMESVIFGSHLQAFLGEYDDTKLTKTFEGLIDMMKCVFEDPARMSRLEALQTTRLSFSDLMRSCSEVESDVCRESTRNCKTLLLRLLSNTCRDVSTCCYNAICDLSDGGEIDHGCYSECLQSCLMKTVNLFAVGVVVVMTYATNLRMHIAAENGITEYTAMLLNTLKSV
ncbi:MAG: hypothetical protein NC114_10745 [Ruminococcus flavefaciens]|nr:hypothetical protein [Ruminococcus flavefaciens]